MEMLLFRPCTDFFLKLQVTFLSSKFCCNNFPLFSLIQTSYSFYHENNYRPRNDCIVGNYYRARITKKNNKKGWLTGRICSLLIAEGFLQMRSYPDPIYKRNRSGMVMERLGLLCNLGVTEEPQGLMDTVLQPSLRIFLVCLLYLKIKMPLFKPMLSAQDGAWKL